MSGSGSVIRFVRIGARSRAGKWILQSAAKVVLDAEGAAQRSVTERSSLPAAAAEASADSSVQAPAG